MSPWTAHAYYCEGMFVVVVTPHYQERLTLRSLYLDALSWYLTPPCPLFRYGCLHMAELYERHHIQFVKSTHSLQYLNSLVRAKGDRLLFAGIKMLIMWDNTEVLHDQRKTYFWLSQIGQFWVSTRYNWGCCQLVMKSRGRGPFRGWGIVIFPSALCIMVLSYLLEFFLSVSDRWMWPAV